MTEHEFRKLLAEQGFDAPLLIERAAAAQLDNHVHPFEALALILSGDITISTEQGDTTYHPGETFHLQPNELHREAFGPQGVRYLSGRKYE
ncbi:cupin [Pantoea agglomerans]|uniref:cupin domain-containing protein n=1 Tax=Enterobacter agglomerans TaxID=549 RepID=UPI000B349FC3|nr:AraC family ligand binding domain-containing protein [Pantoea agglomerans]PHP92718.1 cupin [Pantoea agglomerans]